MDKPAFHFNRINNIIGWLLGLLASGLYIITSEPTVSYWDCGEYIATADKLLVGHPPGAPLFQLIGRFFSLFSFGDNALVARMVNTMTAVASGFTIMFLFWSITHLARKIVVQKGGMKEAQRWAIFGSGIVGACAYAFSDSFWFSAVEGEVYGMSSFFTAIVFWAILKWEESADSPYAIRWLLVIAYMIGLSIGVHLLNLLTIPAMVMVFYFRKYKPSRKGALTAALIAFLLLALIMNGIIPWIVKLASYFELFFVNSLRMPFNVGTIVYFILLIGGLIWGLHYTKKTARAILNTIILAFTFIIVGYSSFLMLVIRSNADPTIDENNPDNAINLLAYLQREQYGDWPILSGYYFTAPIIGGKDGTPVYAKDKAAKKYVVIDDKKSSLPNYDPRFRTLFPRMWSPQSEHEQPYKNWAGLKGIPIQAQSWNGETATYIKPSFGENLRFFFRYQLNFMYWRYFMWNFAGRQNDIQGMGRTENPNGDILHGNWMSGVSFLDEHRLGPQDQLPDSMKNKGRNYYYFLPLILGLLGLVFQIQRNYKDSIVLGLLFFMTGIAIVLYLNQYAPQPRERDYAYAASFYAFAIWIGLGVIGLITWLGEALKKPDLKWSAAGISLLCFVSVPMVMASEAWDDHDRSGRYTVLDIASDYLNSCAPNAILFTNGDNDTFPLWYAQEVEGLRTDVRVCNLSLLQTDWYIDQMKRKAYLSDPVPFSLTKEQYRSGTLEFVELGFFPEEVDTNSFYDLKTLIDSVATRGYIPTRKFSIPVDKAAVIASGAVSADKADNIVSAIEWKLDRRGVSRSHLMVLDLLAHFGWERPLYFAQTIGDENYLDLQNYFQQEGLAYRLVPIYNPDPDGPASVNTKLMYENVMNRFKLRMNDPSIYFSEDHLRMTLNMRSIFGRLANGLVAEGKNDSAISVCDRCLSLMPEKVSPYNYFILPIVEAYYGAGANAKANALADRVLLTYTAELDYYFSFDKKLANALDRDKGMAIEVIKYLAQIAERYQDKVMMDKTDKAFEKYYPKFYNEAGVMQQ